LTTGRLAPRALAGLLVVAFLLAHACFALLPFLFEPWNWRATDLLLRMRPARYDPALAYVVVGDETTEALGVSYLDRTHYARVVENLHAAGVALQVHDVVWRASRTEEEDRALVEAVRRAGNVVLGFVARLDREEAEDAPSSGWAPRVEGDAGALPACGRPVWNLPALADAAAGQGFIDTDADGDGVFRRAPLLARCGERFQPSLPLLAACLHLGVEPERIVVRPGRSLALGDVAVPIDDRGRMRVPFLRWDDADHYAFEEIFHAAGDDLEVLRARLEGRVVLVANASTAGRDIAPTPLDPYDPLPGLQGSVFTGIVTGQFLRDLGALSMLPFEIALLAGIFVLGRQRSTALLLGGSVGLALLFAGAAVGSFLWLGWILHLVRPVMMALFGVLALLAYRYLMEERARAAVQATFQRYFPPTVARRLVADPQRLHVGGERKQLTVLFSDITGFTARSAHMEPDDVQAMLNRYFEAMVDLVFEHGGTLDKFMGDGLMVFFGDPEPQPDHALRCVRCAIAMQRRLDELNAIWESEGKPPIRIRIGINTGPMIVGNMGSPRRLSYTVIGSAVNLGARLEPKAPVGGILVSQATRDALEGAIETEPVDPIEAKGFDDPVPAFVVVH